MARLPTDSPKLIILSIILVSSLFLVLDFNFGTFKPIKIIYKSSIIGFQTISNEFIKKPVSKKKLVKVVAEYHNKINAYKYE